MREDESQKAIEELARFVAEQLNAGTPRHEIIKGLTDVGLKQSEAEQFVNHIESLRHKAQKEAYKQAGTKDFLWGFLFLIGGVVITLVTWAVAKPGGSYWVMWGAMAIGAFYILRGFYRKIKNATDGGARLMWVLGGIILIGGIVGGGVAITNMTTPPELTPPSDSFIVSEGDLIWEDEIEGILRVSGTISNTHSEWSIKNVKVEVRALDDKEDLIKTYEVSVVPSTISPGGKGVCYETIQVPYSCVAVDSTLVWEWEPPSE
jgi:hypothetical protein